MNLIIDIGNTKTKISVYHRQKKEESEILLTKNIDKIYPVLSKYRKRGIEKAIFSSVANTPADLPIYLNQEFKLFIELSAQTKIPIQNRYKSASLGRDRLAAIVGAYNIFPKSNVLVVDAGTALTFDLLNEKGEYVGGNISLGMTMRYKALNSFTDKLPLLEQKDEFVFLADNTNDAIISGVQNGLIFEVEKYIEKLHQTYTGLKVILTGGDSIFFDNKLKNTIFVEPFLVEIGLNTILEYNDNNN
ncbi:MAG: pantothenate kinase [Bacteroidia bacterium]|nr:MAG: pantothenate kinase [Bacteroidia bacterium]